MGMKITGQGLMKGAIYTALAMVVLGLIKVAAPDLWAKVPGLKEF